MTPSFSTEGDAMKAEDVAAWIDGAHTYKRPWDVPSEAVTAIHTLIAERDALRFDVENYARHTEHVVAERDALRAALIAFRSYGCPICHGDCSSANPPPLRCPMRMAAKALKP